MTTNNWRQEFDKQFSSVGDLFSFEPVKAFIETQIAQAEKRGEERMKEKIRLMQFVDSSQAGQFSLHADGYNQAIEDLLSISSL